MRDWIRRNPAAAGLLAAGAVLRLVLLQRPSLWTDEACTLIISRAPLAQIPHLIAGIETTPILYFLLLHLWLPLWGDALIGMRLLSALCGIIGLALFWPVCRRLAGGAAALAFALGAFSSLWIHAAQTGRCYALMLALSCAQVLLALRLSERWTERDAWLYWFLAVAGLYTHYFYAFFLLGLFLSLWKRAPKHWPATHATAGLCAAPAFLGALVQRKMELGMWPQTEAFSPRNLSRLVGAFLFDPGYLGLALPGTAAALGLAALVLAVWGAWKLRESAVRFCAINLLVPLAAAAAVEVWNGKAMFQARYLVFLGVFLFPLLALAVEKAAGGIARSLLRAGLALVVLAGTCAYFVSNVVVDPRLGELSAFIRRAAPEDEPIVHWGALEYAALRSYYLPERRHLLVDLSPGDARYSRLPGYPGVIRPEELAAFGKVIVIDPERRAFAHRVGESTGPDLYRLITERR